MNDLDIDQADPVARPVLTNVCHRWIPVSPRATKILAWEIRGPAELSGRGSKDARRQRATSHMLEQTFTGNRIHTDGPGTFGKCAKIVAVKQMITINLPALPLF